MTLCVGFPVQSCPSVSKICAVELRLADGPDDSSGRVEVCLCSAALPCPPASPDSWRSPVVRVQIAVSGIWGTMWTIDNAVATVICRQLGLETPGRPVQSVGPGSGPVWIQGIPCKGDEARLLDCGNSWGFVYYVPQPWQYYHQRDVAIQCGVPLANECELL